VKNFRKDWNKFTENSGLTTLVGMVSTRRGPAGGKEGRKVEGRIMEGGYVEGTGEGG